jgi:hypothetical protein
MRFVILLIFVAAAVASVPIRDGCTEDSSIVANVEESDPIQVRHGIIGETLPCYAVSVTQSENEIRGYILGATLPAIQEFERRQALESRLSATPAPVSEKKNPAASASMGPPFEPWAGTDIKGKQMRIGGGDAKVTLIAFWSSESVAGRRAAEILMKTESEFRAKGVQAYGLVDAPSLVRLNYRMDDMGLDYPQALDRQGLAARYNANPNQGTTLVIDASNHIVVASSNPAEIRAAVAKLLN